MNKSKILLVLFFSLFISFYSCDKPGQLEGTTWERERESVHLQITIYFGSGKADINLVDHDNSYMVIAYYTLKGKKVTLTLSSLWDSNLNIFYDIQLAPWTGKVEKNIMTLNVGGEIVEFKKR